MILDLATKRTREILSAAPDVIRCIALSPAAVISSSLAALTRRTFGWRRSNERGPSAPDELNIESRVAVDRHYSPARLSHVGNCGCPGMSP